MIVVAPLRQPSDRVGRHQRAGDDDDRVRQPLVVIRVEHRLDRVVAVAAAADSHQEVSLGQIVGCGGRRSVADEADVRHRDGQLDPVEAAQGISGGVGGPVDDDAVVEALDGCQRVGLGPRGTNPLGVVFDVAQTQHDATPGHAREAARASGPALRGVPAGSCRRRPRADRTQPRRCAGCRSASTGSAACRRRASRRTGCRRPRVGTPASFTVSTRSGSTKLPSAAEPVTINAVASGSISVTARARLMVRRRWPRPAHSFVTNRARRPPNSR